ncbi:ABC transporter permease DevC [Parvibaculaceae bacterium PLY_AMNH_Bact1]|nr:ABC transporter permease DevC [Parvibaculaceae bacterium PLY_AMNH_Bact1]
MTALLTALLGRLPIGWLQLKHNKSRLAAAIAGVAFANILIFMQLGFLGALVETTKLPYRPMVADILISASDANTLSDGSNVARQRLYQALAVPGVANASPFYLGKFDWQRDNGTTVNFQVFGIDPTKQIFSDPEIDKARTQLQLLDTALLDRSARNIESELATTIDSGMPHRFEANGRTLNAVSTFSIGAGFEADGYLIVSDQTFLKMYPGRTAGAPTHILVTVEPGVSPQSIVQNLQNTIPEKDVIIRTVEEAAAADEAYQTTERPVGVIFGFGVIIGVLVGLIIVYQVLSTDVADHLSEYATLKAVGYKQSFFLSIVFEEAIILAIFGFIPGVLFALGLYDILTSATGLPVEMTATRAITVLLGTSAMCLISGAIATRRLAGANPADLF